MLPKHLALLQAMFPGVLMLDIDQIASLMKYGRGHLYNLSSEGKLPFKVSRGVGNKILVSIVELAAYLDKTTLSEYDVPAAPQPELVVKKRGRPRGSTTKAQTSVHGFQSALVAAIYRVEAQTALAGLHESLREAVREESDLKGCDERVRRVSDHMFKALDEAQESYEQVHHMIEKDGESVLPRAVRLYPFFVESSSLISAMALDDAGLKHLGIQSQPEVCWMTWEQSLAKVWSDEASRVRWLEKIEVLIPGLCDRVKGLRHAALSRV